MKLSIFLLLLIMQQSVLANDKVLLLISLDITDQKSVKKQKKLMNDLSDLFKSKFENTELIPEIKINATPEELHLSLMNSDYKGVFWLSHANAKFEGKHSGLDLSSIKDFKGNEVKDIFKNVHSKLEFLGIVGCSAQAYFDRLKEEGHFRVNKELIIHARSKVITAKRGLKKSIKNFLKYHKEKVLKKSENKNAECMTPKKRLKIVRTSEKKSNLIAARLMHGKKLLAVLPPRAKPYETQAQLELAPNYKLELIGFNAKTNGELGKITVSDSSGEQLRWERLNKKDGTPLGKNRHIYKLIPVESKTWEAIKDFRCL